MAHQHRSSGLKQKNKKHKTNASSKRLLSRRAGAGRVQRTSLKGTAKNALSKVDRQHMAQQRRDKARQAKLLEARGDGSASPPVVIGIIALSGDSLAEAKVFEESVRQAIVQEATTVVQGNINDKLLSVHASVTCHYANQKKHLTLLTNCTAFYTAKCPEVKHHDDDEELEQEMDETTNDDAAIHAALDLVRVCDAILFLVNGTTALHPLWWNDELTESDIGDGGSIAGLTFATMQTKRFEKSMSERGERMLTALKAQGVPTPITALCYDADNALLAKNSKKMARKRNQVKKYATRLATTEFGSEAKVVDFDLDLSQLMQQYHPLPDILNLDNNPSVTASRMEENNNIFAIPDNVTTDMDMGICDKDDLGASSSTSIGTHSKSPHMLSMLVRTLCGSTMMPVKWASMRSHMVTHGNEAQGGYLYDSETQQLSISGYLRGVPPLNVNALVHVPHLGTFAIKHVLQTECPTKMRRKDANMSDASKLLAESDPMKRESLDHFATPDALEGEQNLVGFEEDDAQDDDDQSKDEPTTKPRPAGWSDYQAAWLDALDPQDAEFEDDVDYGELAKSLNAKPKKDVDEDDDLSISSEERAALAEQRRKNFKEDLTFPDEIELQQDETAKDRLARYRSLKSFRTSHWDPKESLPESYKDIYHFASFKATQRDILAEVQDMVHASLKSKLGNAKNKQSNEDIMVDGDEDDADLLEGCIASGTFVTVVLEGVPKVALDTFPKETLLAMVALLPHENKVSVLHMGISQTSTCEPGTVPVKSKDTLSFRCGWRTWQGRAIFSQHNLNSTKHKYERFLTPNAFVAASVFGPVTYTPCPVLVYREPTKDNARRQLVAFGSMLSADADRLIVKRIVLTGFPTRVHKRHATVKYMFYNPDDVKWFMPAGLTTKHGLQGHILESVGEHGTMKCLFNAPIKQHDTVCLPLYKRVYPKYANVPEDETGPQRLIVW